MAELRHIVEDFTANMSEEKARQRASYAKRMSRAVHGAAEPQVCSVVGLKATSTMEENKSSATEVQRPRHGGHRERIFTEPVMKVLIEQLGLHYYKIKDHIEKPQTVVTEIADTINAQVLWHDSSAVEWDVGEISVMNVSKSNKSKSSSPVSPIGSLAEKPPLSPTVLLPGVADEAASASVNLFFCHMSKLLGYAI
ncbi:hypothetical protein FHG87_024761 [Trinorchestia longiramus]|nr:hypothetical protein FHG87_024761 [Trinorchestia longiramus]